MTATTPVDDLYRGLPGAVELRDDSSDADSGSYLHGHFSVFDRWYEIDSWYEGRFLERTAAGSFVKTIKENRDNIKVQFDHGFDRFVGDSPLGPIEELFEDETGPFYGVPLLDTDYNRERILPLLQGRTIDGRQLGSLLGSSFRFRVTREEWVEPTKATSHNPEKLPERTIREVRLYEFGPVVFPANPDATAAARSLSDHYIARRLQQEGRAERAARALAPHLDVDAANPGTSTPPTVTPAERHLTGMSLAQLQAQRALHAR